MNLNQLIEFASGAESASGPDRIDTLRRKITESGADPGALANDAAQAFNAAYNGGDYSLDDAAAMEMLADISDAAKAAQARQSATTDRIAELASRVNTFDSDSEEGSDEEGLERDQKGRFRPREAVQGVEGEEEDGEEGGGSGGGRERQRSGVTPSSSKSRRDDEDEEEGDGGEGGNPGSASSRRRVTLSSQQLNAQRQQSLPANGRISRSMTLTAGADVPDVPAGKNLALRDLGEVARQRMNSMPVGQPTNGEMRRTIANINRVYSESLIADGQNPMADAELIDRISDEKNLPGGSLVAAAEQQAEALTASVGGMQTLPTPPGDIWCSPSETDYSLCPALASERAGILDLPSFQVRRGGVRYPVWKQFPDQRRPPEHGPGEQEISNDQAQGWYPSHDPAQDYPYDAQHTSDPPRHDWHGYAHLDRNTIGGRPDLEDPDYFIRNPKKAIFGPCVEFAEERMHSAYLWIEESILRNHTFPELSERFMSDALVQHAHFMNETYLRWIASHSDRLDPFWAGAPGWGGPGDPPRNGIVPPGPMSYPVPVSTNNFYPGSNLDYSSWGNFGMGSAAEAVLERIGYLCSWFRNTYRMPRQASMEVVAPMWFRDFLRIDLERKINRPHKPKVSDDEVDQIFRAWGAKVNWVMDWQDLPSTEYNPVHDQVMPTHIMPRSGWPNAVDLLIYPAGSWVLAEQNICRLDATYDSNRLRNNVMTSLFLEDGWMLLNKCNRSFVVQLRGLCANGAVGDLVNPCSSEAIPARREQIKAGDGGDHKPPQALDGPGNNSPGTQAADSGSAAQQNGNGGNGKAAGNGGAKKSS